MSRHRAYSPVSISFHWAIAALFLGQILLGFSMERLKSMALQFELIQWHKSFGFLILALAVLRLCWRIVAGAPAADASLGRIERLAAATVQGALLALTLIVPLAGWALASTSTLGIPSFVFDLVLIPPLPLPPSAEAEAFWREAHELLAYLALLLVAGHAAAALRHHFLLRDNVLGRMVPGLGAGLIRRTNDDA
ncbi:cytochrome b [Mesorhizobium sp. KR9-304]|uniref:cytochrome b n=1 Tax=Mesorhizobium sp. KR9-304 TaxID=3156614 RepID=UPI0032B5EA49